MKIDIRFIRHGECTDYKKDRLTPRGKKSVEKLAKKICPGEIICASSGRAFQTAEILSRGKVKVETSLFLDEVPEIDQEKEFNPEVALRCAQKAIWFIYNKILEGNESLLVITSGGLLGVIEFFLKHKGKIPKTEKKLRLSSPLKGIRIRLSIQIETIS